jgi:hypothetical protein
VDQSWQVFRDRDGQPRTSAHRDSELRRDGDVSRNRSCLHRSAFFLASQLPACFPSANMSSLLLLNSLKLLVAIAGRHMMLNHVTAQHHVGSPVVASLLRQP